jgi:hypothetical protein
VFVGATTVRVVVEGVKLVYGAPHRVQNGAVSHGVAKVKVNPVLLVPTVTDPNASVEFAATAAPLPPVLFRFAV